MVGSWPCAADPVHALATTSKALLPHSWEALSQEWLNMMSHVLSPPVGEAHCSLLLALVVLLQEVAAWTVPIECLRVPEAKVEAVCSLSLGLAISSLATLPGSLALQTHGVKQHLAFLSICLHAALSAIVGC